jgi:putative transposase
VYEKIILHGYVSSYEQTDKGLIPVIPPQGTFPNQRQVRHVIATDVDKLERILRATTKGHFDRNKRGLRGMAIDGVSGPGHTYAIDSTVADMYLRSSINRSWLIGRPIVYVIVDMWSTAVVGFYICLSAPSWATAKVSLFSSLCRPGLLADLWGFDGITSLDPAPALPFRLLCDRGEYLSQGAARTGIDLGLNAAFNPAYRPDLKGLVEVLHRIVKDEQYSSFVPGAMDARRRELELRPDLRESMMTMREYAQYLHLAFTQYNLFADRTHRLTGDMIAAGVVPSPAGLWRFGHEAGFGFLKAIPEQRLITSLLPVADVSVRRNGIFMAQLQYQAEVAVQSRVIISLFEAGHCSEQGM